MTEKLTDSEVQILKRIAFWFDQAALIIGRGLLVAVLVGAAILAWLGGARLLK